MSVVRSEASGWKPLEQPGVGLKLLRADRTSGASTFLVRMEPGARVPLHDHPAGEEIFVVEGEVRIGGERLGPGDYLYTPPDARHAATSEAGCVFLVVLPQPVRVVEPRA